MRFAALPGILIIAAGFLLSGDSPSCQDPREMPASIENQDFSQGTPGSAPPGWFLGPEWFSSGPPAHEAITLSGAACNSGRQCAILISGVSGRSLSFLYQVVDAKQYRGKRLSFQADVRADPDQGGIARLLVRVHRVDCSTGFRDDMGDHPITGGTWSAYRIDAQIAQDARDLEFGMPLVGKGADWIDNIRMNFADAVK